MDEDTAKKLYDALYTTMARSLGEIVLTNMTGKRRNSFDKTNPMDSLNTLIEPLIDMFGKNEFENILSTIVECDLDRNSAEIMVEIKETTSKKK